MLLLSRTFAAVTQAVIAVILARLVGPAQFGEISAVIGVSGALFVVADLGMATLISRTWTLGEHGVVQRALRINAWSTVACLVLLTASALALALSADTASSLVLLVMALSIEKPIETILAVPIAEGDLKVVAQSILYRRCTHVALFLALVTVIDAAWAFATSYAISSIVGQIHIRISLRQYKFDGKPMPTFRSVIRRGRAYLVATSTAQLRTVDTPLVAAISGAAHAGQYAAAGRLMAPFLLLSSSLASLTLPRMTRASGAQAWRTSMRMSLIALTALGGFAPILLFSDRVAVVVFGPAFAKAGLVFSLTLLGIPFVALAAPLGSVLQGIGEERFVAHNGAMFALVNIVAVLAGAVIAGPEGAATAVGLTYAGKCASLLFRVRGLRAAAATVRGGPPRADSAENSRYSG